MNRGDNDMDVPGAPRADDADDVAAARAGDRAAFDRLVAPHIDGLRELAYRMLGHSQDAEDVVQDALERALSAIARFEARAAVRTWLWTIVARACLDDLRARRRFRVEVLGDAEARSHAAGQRAGMLAVYADAGVRFDAREHIAFCLTCVGRTLAPEAHAAVVLREVLGLENREAAEVLGVSESVLRHHLAAGRASMQSEYEGLCALVNKTGVCNQCRTLREAAPSDRRSTEAPLLPVDLLARVAVAREHSPRVGRSLKVHDYLMRAMTALHGG